MIDNNRLNCEWYNGSSTALRDFAVRPFQTLILEKWERNSERQESFLDSKGREPGREAGLARRLEAPREEGAQRRAQRLLGAHRRQPRRPWGAALLPRPAAPLRGEPLRRGRPLFLRFGRERKGNTVHKVMFQISKQLRCMLL